MREAIRSASAVLRAACVLALLALLAGCAALVPQTVALRTGWPAGVPQKAEIAQVPFFPDERDHCGPAALATVLGHAGANISIDELARKAWTPARRGSLQLEMLAAPRHSGHVSMQLAPEYAALLREVAAGNPVIVLQDVSFHPLFTMWHYAVVVGFDYDSGTLYLRSGTEQRKAMPFTAFERTWIKGNYWAMVAMPPGRVPATATPQQWMDAVLAMARVAPAPAVRRAWQGAVARWPDNLQAAIGLANAHHAAGDMEQAVRVLRAALEKHPDSVVAMNNLAQTLSDQGRQREALAQAERALAIDSPYREEVRGTRELILERLRGRQRSAAH